MDIEAVEELGLNSDEVIRKLEGNEMSEINFDARNRAIAEQLMNEYGDNCPCIPLDFPAYHSDPAAFCRLLDKLSELNYGWTIAKRIISGNANTGVRTSLEKELFHEMSNGNKNYKQALVLAITEEGRFCPKCRGEMTTPIFNDGEYKSFYRCMDCNCVITKTEKILTARVRPELEGK